MNRADCKALRSAALELVSWARSMRDSCINQGTGKLDEEEFARVQGPYEKHMRLVRRLRQIANAEQAKLPKKPRIVSLEITECNPKEC